MPPAVKIRVPQALASKVDQPGPATKPGPPGEAPGAEKRDSGLSGALQHTPASKTPGEQHDNQETSAHKPVPRYRPSRLGPAATEQEPQPAAEAEAAPKPPGSTCSYTGPGAHLSALGLPSAGEVHTFRVSGVPGLYQFSVDMWLVVCIVSVQPELGRCRIVSDSMTLDVPLSSVYSNPYLSLDSIGTRALGPEYAALSDKLRGEALAAQREAFGPFPPPKGSGGVSAPVSRMGSISSLRDAYNAADLGVSGGLARQAAKDPIVIPQDMTKFSLIPESVDDDLFLPNEAFELRAKLYLDEDEASPDACVNKYTSYLETGIFKRIEPLVARAVRGYYQELAAEKITETSAADSGDARRTAGACGGAVRATRPGASLSPQELNELFGKDVIDQTIAKYVAECQSEYRRSVQAVRNRAANGETLTNSEDALAFLRSAASPVERFYISPDIPVSDGDIRVPRSLYDLPSAWGGSASRNSQDHGSAPITPRLSPAHSSPAGTPQKAGFSVGGLPHVFPSQETLAQKHQRKSARFAAIHKTLERSLHFNAIAQRQFQSFLEFVQRYGSVFLTPDRNSTAPGLIFSLDLFQLMIYELRVEHDLPTVPLVEQAFREILRDLGLNYADISALPLPPDEFREKFRACQADFFRRLREGAGISAPQNAEGAAQADRETVSSQLGTKFSVSGPGGPPELASGVLRSESFGNQESGRARKSSGTGAEAPVGGSGLLDFSLPGFSYRCVSDFMRSRRLRPRTLTKVYVKLLKAFCNTVLPVICVLCTKAIYWDFQQADGVQRVSRPRRMPAAPKRNGQLPTSGLATVFDPGRDGGAEPGSESGESRAGGNPAGNAEGDLEGEPGSIAKSGQTGLAGTSSGASGGAPVGSSARASAAESLIRRFSPFTTVYLVICRQISTLCERILDGSLRTWASSLTEKISVSSGEFQVPRGNMIEADGAHLRALIAAGLTPVYGDKPPDSSMSFLGRPKMEFAVFAATQSEDIRHALIHPTAPSAAPSATHSAVQSRAGSLHMTEGEAGLGQAGATASGRTPRANVYWAQDAASWRGDIEVLISPDINAQIEKFIGIVVVLADVELLLPLNLSTLAPELLGDLDSGATGDLSGDEALHLLGADTAEFREFMEDSTNESLPIISGDSGTVEAFMDLIAGFEGTVLALTDSLHSGYPGPSILQTARERVLKHFVRVAELDCTDMPPEIFRRHGDSPSVGPSHVEMEAPGPAAPGALGAEASGGDGDDLEVLPDNPTFIEKLIYNAYLVVTEIDSFVRVTAGAPSFFESELAVFDVRPFKEAVKAEMRRIRDMVTRHVVLNCLEMLELCEGVMGGISKVLTTVPSTPKDLSYIFSYLENHPQFLYAWTPIASYMTGQLPFFALFQSGYLREYGDSAEVGLNREYLREQIIPRLTNTHRLVGTPSADGSHDAVAEILRADGDEAFRRASADQEAQKRSSAEASSENLYDDPNGEESDRAASVITDERFAISVKSSRVASRISSAKGGSSGQPPGMRGDNMLGSGAVESAGSAETAGASALVRPAQLNALLAEVAQAEVSSDMDSQDLVLDHAHHKLTSELVPGLDVRKISSLVDIKEIQDTDDDSSSSDSLFTTARSKYGATDFSARLSAHGASSMNLLDPKLRAQFSGSVLEVDENDGMPSVRRSHGSVYALSSPLFIAQNSIALYDGLPVLGDAVVVFVSRFMATHQLYRRTNIRIQAYTRKFIRLLVSFSDWLSKMASVVHSASSEVKKLQIKDLYNAKFHPKTFARDFPRLTKNLDIDMIEDFFEKRSDKLVSDFIRSLQECTRLRITNSVPENWGVTEQTPGSLLGNIRDLAELKGELDGQPMEEGEVGPSIFNTRVASRYIRPDPSTLVKDRAPLNFTAEQLNDPRIFTLDRVHRGRSRLRRPAAPDAPAAWASAEAGQGGGQADVPVDGDAGSQDDYSSYSESDGEVDAAEPEGRLSTATKARPSCTAHYDMLAIFEELLFVISELKILNDLGLTWGKSLNLDLHVAEPPAESEAVVRPPGIVIVSLYRLQRSYKALLRKNMCDVNTGVFLQLLQDCGSAISFIRSTPGYGNWRFVTDKAQSIIDQVGPKILCLHYLNDPRVTETDLARFAAETGVAITSDRMLRCREIIGVQRHPRRGSADQAAAQRGQQGQKGPRPGAELSEDDAEERQRREEALFNDRFSSAVFVYQNGIENSRALEQLALIRGWISNLRIYIVYTTVDVEPGAELDALFRKWKLTRDQTFLQSAGQAQGPVFADDSLQSFRGAHGPVAQLGTVPEALDSSALVPASSALSSGGDSPVGTPTSNRAPPAFPVAPSPRRAGLRGETDAGISGGSGDSRDGGQLHPAARQAGKPPAGQGDLPRVPRLELASEASGLSAPSQGTPTAPPDLPQGMLQKKKQTLFSGATSGLAERGFKSGFSVSSAKVTARSMSMKSQPLPCIPLLGVDAGASTRIHECLFVVADILGRAHVPETQRTARGVESTLVLLRGLYTSIERLSSLLPEALIILTAMAPAAGRVNYQMLAAFPQVQDARRGIYSTLNLLFGISLLIEGAARAVPGSGDHLQEGAAKDVNLAAMARAIAASGVSGTAGSAGVQGLSPGGMGAAGAMVFGGGSDAYAADAARGSERDIYAAWNPNLVPEYVGLPATEFLSRFRSLTRSLAKCVSDLGDFVGKVYEYCLKRPSLHLHNEILATEMLLLPYTASVLYANSSSYAQRMLSQHPILRAQVFGGLPLSLLTESRAKKVYLMGLASGFERLYFRHFTKMPSQLCLVPSTYSDTRLQREALFGDYRRALLYAFSGDFTRLYTDCLYQSVAYAINALVFVHLDGSPRNFVTLCYDVLQAMKAALVAFARNSLGFDKEMHITPSYKLRECRVDRQLFVGAVQARLYELTMMLNKTLDDAVTFYEYRKHGVSDVKEIARAIQQVKSHQAAAEQILNEIGSDERLHTEALCAGIGVSANENRILSTLLFCLPNRAAIEQARDDMTLQRSMMEDACDVRAPAPKAGGPAAPTGGSKTMYSRVEPREEFDPAREEHNRHSMDLSLFVAEGCLPLTGHYLGKASIFDCIPLNYSHFNVMAKMGTAVLQRIPSILLCDHLRSYSNSDINVIMHHFGRYTASKYITYHVSSYDAPEELPFLISSYVMAGYGIYLCGLEFLTISQLSSLVNIFNTLYSLQGHIPGMYLQSGARVTADIRRHAATRHMFPGFFVIVLPEVIYRGDGDLVVSERGKRVLSIFSSCLEIYVPNHGDIFGQMRSYERRGDKSDSRAPAAAKSTFSRALASELDADGDGYVTVDEMAHSFMHFDQLILDAKNELLAIFCYKTATFGRPLYQISLYLNNYSRICPYFRVEDVDIIMKRVKDQNNLLSVSITTALFLAEQTCLVAVREIIIRVVSLAFGLNTQQQVCLKNIVTALNILQGLATEEVESAFKRVSLRAFEEGGIDFAGQMQRQAAGGAGGMQQPGQDAGGRGAAMDDLNATVNQVSTVTKCWQVLRQYMNPSYVQYCENMAQSTGMLEPSGGDLAALALDFLQLGPIFMTSKQKNHRFLCLMMQIILLLGKYQPIWVHSLDDVHSNLDLILKLGPRCVIVIFCQDTSGKMVPSLFSFVQALLAPSASVRLENNVVVTFSPSNRPKCAVVANSWEDVSILKSNLSLIPRRVIVTQQLVRFSAFMGMYVHQSLHTQQLPLRFTELVRKINVSTLQAIEDVVDARDYFRQLCTVRSAEELAAEAARAARFVVTTKLIATGLAFFTENIFHAFRESQSGVFWPLYRAVLMLMLRLVGLTVNLKGKGTTVTADFLYGSEVARAAEAARARAGREKGGGDFTARASLTDQQASGGVAAASGSVLAAEASGVDLAGPRASGGLSAPLAAQPAPRPAALPPLPPGHAPVSQLQESTQNSSSKLAYGVQARHYNADFSRGIGEAPADSRACRRLDVKEELYDPPQMLKTSDVLGEIVLGNYDVQISRFAATSAIEFDFSEEFARRYIYDVSDAECAVFNVVAALFCAVFNSIHLVCMFSYSFKENRLSRVWYRVKHALEKNAGAFIGGTVALLQDTLPAVRQAIEVGYQMMLDSLPENYISDEGGSAFSYLYATSYAMSRADLQRKQATNFRAGSESDESESTSENVEYPADLAAGLLGPAPDRPLKPAASGVSGASLPPTGAAGALAHAGQPGQSGQSGQPDHFDQPDQSGQPTQQTSTAVSRLDFSKLDPISAGLDTMDSPHNRVFGPNPFTSEPEPVASRLGQGEAGPAGDDSETSGGGSDGEDGHERRGRGSRVKLRFRSYELGVGLLSFRFFPHIRPLLSHHSDYDLPFTLDPERVAYCVYAASLIGSRVPICVYGPDFSGKSLLITVAYLMLADNFYRQIVLSPDTEDSSVFLSTILQKGYLRFDYIASAARAAQQAAGARQGAAGASASGSAGTAGATSGAAAGQRESASPGALSTAPAGAPAARGQRSQHKGQSQQAGSISKCAIDFPGDRVPLFHIMAMQISPSVDDELAQGRAHAKDEKTMLNLLNDEIGAETAASAAALYAAGFDRVSLALGEGYYAIHGVGYQKLQVDSDPQSAYAMAVDLCNASIALEIRSIPPAFLSSQIVFLRTPRFRKQFLISLIQGAWKPPPGQEGAHEFGERYVKQFVDGLIMIQNLLPVSLLRIIHEMKRICMYTNPTLASDVQLRCVSVGLLISAMRNCPQFTPRHVNEVINELSSAVLMGRLLPTSPYGLLNTENMAKFMKANAYMASSAYKGIQNHYTWELVTISQSLKTALARVGEAAERKERKRREERVERAERAERSERTAPSAATTRSGPPASSAASASSGASAAGAGALSKQPEPRGHRAETPPAPPAEVDAAEEREKKRKLSHATVRFRSKNVLDLTTKVQKINQTLFATYVDSYAEYMLGHIDPGVSNRTFAIYLNVASQAEANSREVFSYIQYLRDKALYIKVRSQVRANRRAQNSVKTLKSLRASDAKASYASRKALHDSDGSKEREKGLAMRIGGPDFPGVTGVPGAPGGRAGQVRAFDPAAVASVTSLTSAVSLASLASVASAASVAGAPGRGGPEAQLAHSWHGPKMPCSIDPSAAIVTKYENLALRVPVFVTSQTEVSPASYNVILQLLSVFGGYTVSNKNTLKNMANATLTNQDRDSSMSDSSSQISSFSSLSSVSISQAAEHNPYLGAFYAIGKFTDAAVKRRQRILFDVPLLIQSITAREGYKVENAAKENSEADEEGSGGSEDAGAGGARDRRGPHNAHPGGTSGGADSRAGQSDGSKGSAPGAASGTGPGVVSAAMAHATIQGAGAFTYKRSFAEEFTDHLAKIVETFGDTRAAYYVLRAAVVMALGLNPRLGYMDFTPKESCDVLVSPAAATCTSSLGMSREELLRLLDAECVEAMFLSEPYDVLVTLPYSMMNNILDNSALFGVSSLGQPGSSALKLYTDGELRVLGLLLAEMLHIPYMLGVQEIVNILSRSLAVIVLSDVAAIPNIKLPTTPQLRHTATEDDVNASLLHARDRNVISKSFAVSGTPLLPKPLVQQIPQFVFSGVDYGIPLAPVAKASGAIVRADAAGSSDAAGQGPQASQAPPASQTIDEDSLRAAVYIECFARSCLVVYNFCMRNTGPDPIPYSLNRFSAVAAQLGQRRLRVFLQVVKDVEALVASDALLVGGFRDSMFHLSVRDLIKGLQEELHATRGRLRPDFLRAVSFLRNLPTDSALMAARLMFFPIIRPGLSDEKAFEAALLEECKQHQLTYCSLPTSDVDYSTRMISTLLGPQSRMGTPAQGPQAPQTSRSEQSVAGSSQAPQAAQTGQPDMAGAGFGLNEQLAMMKGREGRGFPSKLIDMAMDCLPTFWNIFSTRGIVAPHASYLQEVATQILYQYLGFSVQFVSVEVYEFVVGCMELYLMEQDYEQASAKAEAAAARAQLAVSALEAQTAEAAQHGGKPGDKIAGPGRVQIDPKTPVGEAVAASDALAAKKQACARRLDEVRAQETSGRAGEYSLQLILKKNVAIVDTHLPAPEFGATFSKALSDRRAIVLLNFGSMNCPRANIEVCEQLVFLIQGRLTRPREYVMFTESFKATIAYALHDYRFYFVLAPSVEFETLIRIGFTSIMNADITCLLRPKFKIKGDSRTLLELQNPECTGLDVKYRLDAIADKFTSEFMHFSCDYSHLEIVIHSSIKQASSRSYAHLHQLAEALRKYLLEDKRVTYRLSAGKEKGSEFAPLRVKGQTLPEGDAALADREPSAGAAGESGSNATPPSATGALRGGRSTSRRGGRLQVPGLLGQIGEDQARPPDQASSAAGTQSYRVPSGEQRGRPGLSRGESGNDAVEPVEEGASGAAGAAETAGTATPSSAAAAAPVAPVKRTLEEQFADSPAAKGVLADKGMDVPALSALCAKIETLLSHRVELADNVAKNQKLEVYAEDYGKSVASSLIMLQRLSIFHPMAAGALSDFFFEGFGDYLERNATFLKSRPFGQVVFTLRWAMQRLLGVVPKSFRGPFLALCTAIYHIAFNMGKAEHLDLLRILTVTDFKVLISHLNPMYNSNIPRFNHARAIAAACPKSFACAPNISSNWKHFALFSSYAPKVYFDWIEFYRQGKGEFAAMNVSDDMYASIIGTYAAEERAHNAAVSGLGSMSQRGGRQGAAAGKPATMLPIVPTSMYSRLERYMASPHYLPPSLQTPSLETTWEALLLSAAIRQDTLATSFDLFCRITPPSQVHEAVAQGDIRTERIRCAMAANQKIPDGLFSEIPGLIVEATLESLGYRIAMDVAKSARGAAGAGNLAASGSRELNPPIHVANTSASLAAAINAEANASAGAAGPNRRDGSDESIDRRKGEADPHSMNHLPQEIPYTEIGAHNRIAGRYQTFADQRGDPPSRTVLIVYDEGLAVAQLVQEVIAVELEYTLGLAPAVLVIAPSADDLQHNTVIADLVFNPAHCIESILSLYRVGVRPAHVLFVLIPHKWLSRDASESLSAHVSRFRTSHSRRQGGAGGDPGAELEINAHGGSGAGISGRAFATRHPSVAQLLASFLDEVRPVVRYVERPATYDACYRHCFTLLQGTSLYTGTSMDSLPPLIHRTMLMVVLRYCVLNSRKMFTLTDSRLQYQFMHLLNQSKGVDELNGLRSFLREWGRLEGGREIASLNAWSTLNPDLCFVKLSPAEAAFYNFTYYKSPFLLHGQAIDMTCSVAVSKLDSKILDRINLKEDNYYDDEESIGSESESFTMTSMDSSSVHSSSKSSSFVTDSSSSFSGRSGSSMRSSTAFSAADMTVSGLSLDAQSTALLQFQTGPQDMARREYRRLLSSKRTLEVIRCSSEFRELFTIPKAVDMDTMILYCKRMASINRRLEAFLNRYGGKISTALVVDDSEVQEELANALQPFRFVRRNEVTTTSPLLREFFTYMLCDDVVFYLQGKVNDTNSYSSAPLLEEESHLPTHMNIVLNLSLNYQAVRRLAAGLLVTPQEEDPNISTPSENFWIVNGLVYEPVLNDLMNWMMLQYCLRSGKPMSAVGIVLLMHPLSAYEVSFKLNKSNGLVVTRADKRRARKKAEAEKQNAMHIKITNMRLFGLAYDYGLESAADVTPESLNYPDVIDVFACVVDKDSGDDMYGNTRTELEFLKETFERPGASKEILGVQATAEGEDVEDVDDYDPDHFISIPTSFCKSWKLHMLCKADLTDADIAAKSPWLGVGHFVE